MRIRSCLLLLCLLAPAVQAQPTSPTLERVRKAGVLRCGGAIRPGLAFPGEDHAWEGLLIDMCRAVAVAAIGPNAKTEFNGYTLRNNFDRARGEDDVSFLTATEMFANELYGAVQPGPAVFYETAHVMVWDTSKVEHLSDLGAGPDGTMVCAEPGTGPERNLLAYTRSHKIKIQYSAWQELEEMMDAYNVGRCPAVTGELTALGALRLGSEQHGHPSRILPEPLAVSPVMVTTPQGDPAWSALAGWTMQTVLASERPNGAGLLPIDGTALGLDRDWQARVIAAGTYAEIFDRTLGHESALDLPRGLNAPVQEGGIIAPASVE